MVVSIGWPSESLRPACASVMVMVSSPAVTIIFPIFFIVSSTSDIVTSPPSISAPEKLPVRAVPFRSISISPSLIFIMPLSFFAIVPDSNANLPLVIAIINDGSSEILSNFSTRNSESLCKVKIELSIKETTIEELGPIFILSLVKIWSNAFNLIRSSTSSLFTLPSSESINPTNFFSAS